MCPILQLPTDLDTLTEVSRHEKLPFFAMECTVTKQVKKVHVKNQK